MHKLFLLNHINDGTVIYNEFQGYGKGMIGLNCYIDDEEGRIFELTTVCNEKKDLIIRFSFHKTYPKTKTEKVYKRKL